MHAMKRLSVLAAFACVLLSACVAGNQAVREAEDTVPASTIGWLHGNCLALADAAAAIDSQVAVVAIGDVQRVVAARITGKTASAEECAPLLEDRSTANLGQGLTFYRVAVDAPVELGIGIVQQEGDQASIPALLDTNGDGKRDTFTHCITSEGVQFSVWAHDAGLGAPLWTGYYYLGYDTEADCPVDG